MIKIFNYYYDKDELITILENILDQGQISYLGDINFIQRIVTKLKSKKYVTGAENKYLIDIIFKYNLKLMDNFLTLSVTSEDIIWAKNQIEKVKTKGIFRYNHVDAYKGVVAEKVISQYMKSKFPKIQLNTPIGEGNTIDEYDFKLNDITCDIKCSTELYHASITPKVDVVKEVPKDVYIGARYDDRDPENNLVYVIGYMTHEEICSYPIKQKYGARFYEVSLPNMNDLKILEQELKDLN